MSEFTERHITALAAVRERQTQFFETHRKDNVNLFDELLRASRQYGLETPIAEDASGSLTYRNLLLNTYVLSEAMQRELKDRKNIGILLPNSLGKLVALFSLFRLKRTPAVLNFSMGEKKLIECCDTAYVRTVLTSRLFIEQAKLGDLVKALEKHVRILYLEDLKQAITRADKLLGLFNFKTRKQVKKEGDLILFTSGSESTPKGVVLTHTALYANMFQALAVLELDPDKDRFFNSLPMFHSFGLTAGALLPLYAGIPVYLYPSPIAYKEIPRLFFETQATVMFGTSTFFAMYAKSAHSMDFARCRYAIAGAEKLQDDVRRTWLDQFGVRILEGYGATETAPILSVNTPDAYQANSVGRLLPGIEYTIKKVEGIEQGGKLLVKGPNLLKGYLLHNEGFIAQDGWYDTGDVVDVDDHGFLTILSRLKRFAKVGGEMVSLNLLEQTAAETYGHSGFYAVAVPDVKKGERLILFTTDPDLHDASLKKYIKQQKLSSLLLPYKIVPIEEAPVLGSGKTDYVALTELAKDVKKGWFKKQSTKKPVPTEEDVF